MSSPIALPRFFADVMLGRLARRLRLAGFDTLYENDVEDGDLVARASAEGRVVLTRDRPILLRRAAQNAVLIHSTQVDEQWRELCTRFPSLTVGPRFSRCGECNALLEATTRDEARGAVPEPVLENHEIFFRCSGCRRIYWMGSHAERIQRDLDGQPPDPDLSYTS